MTLLPWLVIAALIAINAFYVAAEFAALAAQRSVLALAAERGDRRAAGLLSILESGTQLDRYIAACQVGITLSSLIAGAYAQASIARELGPILAQHFALQPASALSSAALIVLVVLTALQVVVGELVPKLLALQYAERTALVTYRPMRASVSFYRGLIWLLNGSGFLLLKPFGITAGGHHHVHSPEELELLFAESRRGGALSAETHAQLRRGLRLSGRSVRQLMVPRGQIDAIDAETPASAIVERILASPYSRLPVYRKSIDHVIGAVSTKDLVGLYAVRGEIPPLEKLLRPIPFVSENLSADRLVRFLREARSSKAIVTDEYGGVQGIISIEDVLGQLFGDIRDELKEPEPGVEPLPDGRVRLSGSIPPSRAEPWLGVRWKGRAATLGGHVVDRLGRLPAVGDRVEIDGVEVTVEAMSPTSVRSVVVRPVNSKIGAKAD